MSKFKIVKELDVCILPFSPVTIRDRVEIRAQVFNSGGDGTVSVSFLLDGEILSETAIEIQKNSFGFANTFVDMDNKAGDHTVTVKLSARSGEVLTPEVTVPLTVMTENQAKLDGGFVMLGPPNDRKPCDTYREELKKMTDEDWSRYVDEMFEIGISSIIINVAHQYLTLEKKQLVAHYPSQIMPKSDIVAVDPIEAILTAAEKNGQKIFLGVGNQFGHKGTKEEMTELYNRYGRFSSFYGWYFATELRMDSTTEAGFAKWKLYDYLYDIAHTLCPVKPILISPMAMPNEQFAERLKSVTFCDIIMPQDWVGQCAFHIYDSEEMYRRLHTICRDAGKHLWANCEAFNFTDTPDGKWENWGCTFKDFPWDAPRVLVPRFRGGGMVGPDGFDKQMEAVRPYSEKIMAFMLSGFFCPTDFEPKCGGSAAVEQYEEYSEYLKKLL